MVSSSVGLYEKQAILDKITVALGQCLSRKREREKERERERGRRRRDIWGRKKDQRRGVYVFDSKNLNVFIHDRRTSAYCAHSHLYHGMFGVPSLALCVCVCVCVR